MDTFDVIVVGAGNAALAAAASAKEHKVARVLVLEKAPRSQRGGNTRCSGGLFRFAFSRAEELRQLVPDADRHIPHFFSSVEPYAEERFRDDLLRFRDGYTDPELANTLVRGSLETMRWVADLGVALEPALRLSAVSHGGRTRWSPGAVLCARRSGEGLSSMWFRIAARQGTEVRYDTAALALIADHGRVVGVSVQGPSGLQRLMAGAVVLACGGFEADALWRARYLGSSWRHAKVRGTAFNTGDGLRMAMELQAARSGDFAGCHATPIDSGAPAHGDYRLADSSNRLSYPYGVMLNSWGERFVDEGEDYPLHTYSKMGGLILGQPGGVAFQIFDTTAVRLLERRYSTASAVVGESLESLINQLPVDVRVARSTLDAYNAAPRVGHFDPTVLDGFATRSLTPSKSNWARPLDTPPFYAYVTTGGITFTYGGVRVDAQARVLASDGSPIPGLFACGEMLGSLICGNYLAGCGLMSGAVFGRIAGMSAAATVRSP